ncbi:hypothetical protein NBT05_00355 [Aquimarina sp. ERC-38]|uniref:hypothetical protein n=1 Tax=Aquimarina sp. ERC-38 TaxID=2949996 RepID=UPI002245FB1E|nr:hypothetical protein [Aquimarina sp. ERC-38]UZO80952.1 hypothetical protein NBT05_00355 [Aquimarina sp. ERC-38]
MSINELFLLSKNSGDITTKVKIDAQKDGILKYFVDNKILIIEDSDDTISFKNPNKNKSYFLTTNGDILSINNQDLSKDISLGFDEIFIDNRSYEKNRLILLCHLMFYSFYFDLLEVG